MSRSLALSDEYFSVNNGAYWDNNEPFSQYDHYSSVPSCKEIDRKPRWKNEISDITQSTLFKLIEGEVVHIYIFENSWAPFSQFKSIWECTAKDVLKIDHAPRIDSDTQAQVWRHLMSDVYYYLTYYI